MKNKYKKVLTFLPHVIAAVAVLITFLMYIDQRRITTKDLEIKTVEITYMIIEDLNLSIKKEGLIVKKTSPNEEVKDKHDRLLRAKKNLSKLEKISPDSVKILGLKMAYLFETKDVKGLDQLLMNSDGEYNRAGAFVLFATIVASSGRLGEAHDYFDKAIAMSKQDPEILYMHSIFLHEINDNMNSVKQLDRVIGKQPRKVELKNFKAHVLLESNQGDKAKELLQEVISTGNANAATFNGLGAVFNKEFNFVSAIDSISEALELDPDNTMYHYNLYLLYNTIGDFKSRDNHKAILTLQGVKVKESWDYRSVVH